MQSTAKAPELRPYIFVGSVLFRMDIYSPLKGLLVDSLHAEGKWTSSRVECQAGLPFDLGPSLMRGTPTWNVPFVD